MVTLGVVGNKLNVCGLSSRAKRQEKRVRKNVPTDLN